MPHCRKALLDGFTALATAAEATPGIPDNDRILIVLGADLLASENAFNADVAECEQVEQPFRAYQQKLLDHMAATPATGVAGAAAKAAWLCVRLAQSGVMPAEAALVRSLAADLAWHQPEAVGP